MKKGTITLLLCMLIGRSFAQINLSVEAGYNKSIFNTNVPGNTIVTSPINRFQGGVLGTKNFKKKFLGQKFFLQSGLQFAEKGSYQGRGFQAIYGSNTTFHLSYLQVPLSIGFTVKAYKEINAVFSAGLYAAYALSGKEQGTSNDLNGSEIVNRNVTFAQSITYPDNTKTYIKPLDTGYNLSFGLSYKKVLVKTVYSLGFHNVSPVSSTLYRNEIWNFSLAYLLPWTIK